MAAARASATEAQVNVESLRAKYDVALSRLLASITSGVNEAVAIETQRKVEEMRALASAHKKSMKVLKDTLRDAEAAAFRKDAEVAALLDDAQRMTAEAEVAARKATATAASARATEATATAPVFDGGRARDAAV